jgi:FixJ family two-component response regulator
VTGFPASSRIAPTAFTAAPDPDSKLRFSSLVVTLRARLTGVATRTAAQLTLRQREVLVQVARGRSMKEIAASMNFFPPRAFGTHKYEMIHPPSIRITAAFIRFAYQSGLVVPA